MELSDLYRHNRDEQAMTLVELEIIANMLDEWREGGEVDPEFARYASMRLLAIAQHLSHWVRLGRRKLPAGRRLRYLVCRDMRRIHSLRTHLLSSPTSFWVLVRIIKPIEPIHDPYGNSTCYSTAYKTISLHSKVHIIVSFDCCYRVPEVDRLHRLAYPVGTDWPMPILKWLSGAAVPP